MLCLRSSSLCVSSLPQFSMSDDKCLCTISGRRAEPGALCSGRGNSRTGGEPAVMAKRTNWVAWGPATAFLAGGFQGVALLIVLAADAHSVAPAAGALPPPAPPPDALR